MPEQQVQSARRALRIHQLDAMRSALMLLGVVLHAACPYSLGIHWLVRDPQRNHFFELLTRGIHSFRMPAFFLVAGYFSMLLLTQRPTAAFLRERLRRIGIPLFATLLTLNLAQTWWLESSNTNGGESITWRVLESRWQGGTVLGHLWFLVDLLVFCVILALCARPVRHLLATTRPAWLSATPMLGLLLAGAVACSFTFTAVQHLAPGMLDREYLGLLHPSELLSYLPFFCVGLILQGDERLLARFSSPGLGTTLLGTGAFAIMMLNAGTGTIAGKSLRFIASLLLTWVMIRLILAAFRRYASRPSPVFRYLSDASYSVYLVHHLAVVALASWLVSQQWAAGYKFLLVLVLALGISLAVHHFLILRVPLLRYLFNGKYTKRSEHDVQASAIPVSGASDPGH